MDAKLRVAFRFVNMTSVAGLISWFGICVTFLRFYAGMKAQGMDRKKLPYYSIFQPYAAWYGAIACIVINFVSPPFQPFADSAYLMLAL